MLKLLSFVAVGLLSCCASSSFSGSSSASGNQSTTQPPPATPPPAATTNAQDATGTPGVAASTPANAVTQGSFTVWAVPANPVPRQDYQVFIQVKLPAGVQTYAATDLSGEIQGTDGYVQALGADAVHSLSYTPGASSAVLANAVPGANCAGVQDTIVIHSALLGEDQKVQLIFASASAFPLFGCH